MKSFAALILLAMAIASVHCQDKNTGQTEQKMRPGSAEHHMRQMSGEQHMRQMPGEQHMRPMTGEHNMRQTTGEQQMRQGSKDEGQENMVGSAYARPYVPAPPCPRNYLFSCQLKICELLYLLTSNVWAA